MNRTCSRGRSTRCELESERGALEGLDAERVLRPGVLVVDARRRLARGHAAAIEDVDVAVGVVAAEAALEEAAGAPAFFDALGAAMGAMGAVGEDAGADCGGERALDVEEDPARGEWWWVRGEGADVDGGAALLDGEGAGAEGGEGEEGEGVAAFLEDAIERDLAI